jgi:hypothetical protein
LNWTVETLYALKDDPVAFETERSRIISEYIKSLPEDRRKTAYAMQCKIDLARETMSGSDFLLWMGKEAVELGENLADQLLAIRHLVDGPPRSA